MCSDKNKPLATFYTFRLRPSPAQAGKRVEPIRVYPTRPDPTPGRVGSMLQNLRVGSGRDFSTLGSTRDPSRVNRANFCLILLSNWLKNDDFCIKIVKIFSFLFPCVTYQYRRRSIFITYEGVIASIFWTKIGWSKKILFFAHEVYQNRCATNKF